MLCEWPAPHGPLLAWLDSQHHDHGAQPWSALREALRGHEHEAFAVAEVAKAPPEIESDLAELEDILDKERSARMAEEMKRLEEQEKIIDSQLYFLPINATAHKRAMRHTVIGLALILLFGTLLFLAALDANLIKIPGFPAPTDFL